MSTSSEPPPSCPPTRVLVSACLLGRPVRYDGRGAPRVHPVLARWQAEGRVVAICPEMAGGLPTPRPPAEITHGDGGARVLDGLARVIDITGADVTTPFVNGAQAALDAARQHGVTLAVLKEGSPSCGSGYIYDGSFSGQRLAGQGVTAALLAAAGVRVFSEQEFDAADAAAAEAVAASAVASAATALAATTVDTAADITRAGRARPA
ncbi:purine-nucleoside phosphorylase [Bordetella genomosp. 5]|uniref:Purine-nucleoside phosphorylase n=1 Tax=Bordetella genomosp. 5 TaxID=1395608 RepID=A0A261U0C2_9BORD|nr:DUF523 domain-containing protein [Bordetella genomosp. 5]OZI55319.1 purine-nucleoside phosphorylase [Bordetella genomosp. 5]